MGKPYTIEGAEAKLKDFYNQATKEAEPTGTQKKMEDALIAPKLETKGYSGPVVEVESFGRKEYVPFLEKYKGMDIVKTGENISVWDSKNKTLFVVALDDSKTSGKKGYNRRIQQYRISKSIY